MSKTRIVSFGLGPIGVRAAQLAAGKNDLEIVGAIDINPELVGRDLGEICDHAGAKGVEVSADAAATLARTKPDCVIHCTSSFIPAVQSQIEGVIDAGANLITSTEEMLWPRLQQPAITDELDARAKRTASRSSARASTRAS